MAHFPALKPLINDMMKKHSDREHFCVTYATVTFDIIISLDVPPSEILIGGEGINWACAMKISDDLEITMPDKDFYALRKALPLKKNGIENLGFYIFLNFIAVHAPKHCSGTPVQPPVMQRWYSKKVDSIDPENRTVFYRWVDQNERGNKAHNFEKTEAYFGKSVADYCRKHNISSQWLTPEQAVGKNIQSVRYPWV